jgi:hypothetical protein
MIRTKYLPATTESDDICPIQGDAKVCWIKDAIPNKETGLLVDEVEIDGMLKH